jgi:hypothetical protein
MVIDWCQKLLFGCDGLNILGFAVYLFFIGGAFLVAASSRKE